MVLKRCNCTDVQGGSVEKQIRRSGLAIQYEEEDSGLE